MAGTIGPMLRTNLPRALRALRRRRGWRQIDLAGRTGISRQVISRMERGQLSGIGTRTLVRVAEGLDATLELTVRWQGEGLNRLTDATHAQVVEAAAAMLRGSGWLARTEVSFNHYGDRGRVDLLAFHPTARVVVVVEAKSAIGDTQDTVGRLDVKARLGPTLAASEGWGRPVGVVPALVIAESRTARRVVQGHPAAFARFVVRGRSAVAWLRHPGSRERAPSGLLWFVAVPDSLGGSVTRGRRMRAAKLGR